MSAVERERGHTGTHLNRVTQTHCPVQCLAAVFPWDTHGHCNDRNLQALKFIEKMCRIRRTVNLIIA